VSAPTPSELEGTTLELGHDVFTSRSEVDAALEPSVTNVLPIVPASQPTHDALSDDASGESSG
jgi:hypothetical protein